MDKQNNQSGTTGTSKQSDQDIERAVEAQAEGQQPLGVETEQVGQAQAQSSEVDKRDSKGVRNP